MTVGGVDDEQVDPGVDQPLGPFHPVRPHRGGGTDAQRTVGILGGGRVELAFLHILDGDQARAVAGLIDDQQLFDAVLVQQLLGLRLFDAFLHRHQTLAGHQFIDLLGRVVGEAHIAVGQDADEPPGLAPALPAILDDRNAGDTVGAHQFHRVGQGGVRADGQRIDHHAAFELLDLPHFLRLLFRREVAVDDAHATGLRHGDGEAGFRHRIHRGRQDRQVENDLLRQPRGDIHLAGHDGAVAGLQQHIVECEGVVPGEGGDDLGHGSCSNCARSGRVGQPV